MTNHRLRGALLNAGMTASALAEVVRVDPKSVSRWLTEGRVPHPATRQQVAAVLQQHETYLWPSLLLDWEGDGSAAAVACGIGQAWPMRCQIGAEMWHQLFNAATKQLDILVYAGAFLIETLDLAEVLAWKALRGTSIRVLVADPGSPAVQLRAEELSLDWLPGRCATTAAYLKAIEGITVRHHQAPHYASLFRFDDILLANVHAAGTWACHSPVLELQPTGTAELFEFYLRSFETIWRASGPNTA